MLLLLFFIGCNKSGEIIENEDIQSNLIQSYIDYAQNNQYSIEERKNNLEKAYNIYSTLDDNNYKVEKIHEIALGYYTIEDFCG